MIQTQDVYKPIYENKDKFIILVTGGRGCEAPDTPVMMADLTIKKIADIRVGEKVMGDDGTPRTVRGLMRGTGKRYLVHQSSGEDYIVNDIHILTVKKSESAKNDRGSLTKAGTYRRPNGRYSAYSDILDIPVEEYMGKSLHFRRNFRGFKISSIPYKAQEVFIDPYILGVWLGDGTGIFPCFTNDDAEVIEAISVYAHSIGCTITIGEKQGTECKTYRVKKLSGKTNPFLDLLRKYDLVGNKHIPQEYISNSEDVRLSLLAGLLDTDGSMSRGGYEITQKSEDLAKSIKFIADTLGFRTSVRAKRVRLGGRDCGTYYRVHIGGGVWRIPCKVSRRQVEAHKTQKDWHLSELSVTPAADGAWCGLSLDGNGRYVHADGTVTHNSGKSFNIGAFIERLTFDAQMYDGRLLAHSILYTRYTMVSAAISVIPEFTEKIDLDGTENYFKTTKTDIVNKMTGAKIMFRGIRTSSGNQTAKLKSIHGITAFVCDEAEEWTSATEFDKIMLSIRTKGIQNMVVIIMNPTDSNHFIYKKYIEKTHKLVDFDGVPVQISTHPDVLHIHTSYLDNIEHLSPHFIEEAERCKTTDPERYAHTFMGRWADVAEGAVYKTFGIVDTFPANAKKVALAVDFGYTNDPTAVVKCGVVGNDFYIEEKCYKTAMSTADIIRELREDVADETGKLFVYAESADPRLVDEIANGGIIIYPVQKGPGSIAAGIERIHSFGNIFVARGSYNVQHELRTYVWAKDKDGNYINQPEDHDNHALDAARYYVLGVLMGKVFYRKKRGDDLGIY